MAESTPSLLKLSVALGANSTSVTTAVPTTSGGEGLSTGNLDSRFAALLSQSEGELLKQLQLSIGKGKTLSPEQLQKLLGAQLKSVNPDAKGQASLLLGDAAALISQLLSGKGLPQSQQNLPATAGDSDHLKKLLLDENGDPLLLDLVADPSALALTSDAQGDASLLDGSGNADLAQLLKQLAPAANDAGDPSIAAQTSTKGGKLGQLLKTDATAHGLQSDALSQLDGDGKSKTLSAEQLLAAHSGHNAQAKGADTGGILQPNTDVTGTDTKPLSKTESLLEGLKSLDGGKLSVEAGTLSALAAKSTDATDAKTLNPETLRLSTVPMNFRSPDGNAVAAAQVQTSVFSPDWGEQVAQKLVWFSVNNIHTAKLQLDPPDLGPLQVRINMHNDQATIHFTSQHVAVRDALDQNLPRLREIFVDNGLNLADVNVSDQSSQQSDQAFQQQFVDDGGETIDDSFEQKPDADLEVRHSISYGLNIVDAYA